MGPGSYPRAEVYKINISEDSLLTIIDEFKNENPEFNIDEVAVLDGKHKDWNYRYFFYPDKKIKIMTYVRSGIRKSNLRIKWNPPRSRIRLIINVKDR